MYTHTHTQKNFLFRIHAFCMPELAANQIYFIDGNDEKKYTWIESNQKKILFTSTS